MNRTIRVKRAKGDVAFDTVNYALLTLVLVLVMYPLYFIVIASISNPTAIYEGKVILWPKGVNFDGYARLLAENKIWSGYANTIYYTVLGTLINVVCTTTGAFALSRKRLPFSKLLMYMITFTMFFNGGTIATYILVKKLSLYNTVWALVLPVAVGPWNFIIARTFFMQSIPDELCEASFVDGASNFRLFFSIVLPLSKAILAILVLFYSLQHWNSYFNALIYIKDEGRQPLQLVLRNILITNDATTMVGDQDMLSEKLKLADLLKYGSIIVSTLPLLMAYPFVQKYFVQGVLIGSVKG